MQIVIDVMLSCQVSLNDDQWCPLMSTDPSPHHDTPATKWHNLQNATSRRSSLHSEETVLAFISEDYPLPVTWLPTSYSQGPSQSWFLVVVIFCHSGCDMPSKPFFSYTSCGYSRGTCFSFFRVFPTKPAVDRYHFLHTLLVR